MKRHRRLMQALNEIDKQSKQSARERRIANWLASQPGSVKRGYKKGHVKLPAHLV